MKLTRIFAGTTVQKKLSNELNEYYAFAEGNPDDIRVHLRIADVLMKLGQKHKAIDEYLHAAESYEADNSLQISAAIYNQIVQIDPDQINVYHTLVDIYRREGKVGDAVATYEKLARYYYDQGLKDDVIKTLDKMVNLDPDSIYVKKKIAKFYAEKKMASPSKEISVPCAEWELSDPITTGQPAPQQTLSQDKKESFFDLGAALEDDLITEESEVQHMDKTEGDDGNGMPGFDEIFNEIQQTQSASDDRNESLFHYNLGIAYQKIGRIDEAIDELQKASEDPKRTVDCYLRLAVCAREQNMFSEALRYLKKGLRYTDLPPAKKLALEYEVAVTYKTKGKRRKAQKLFKQIHQIDSTFREVKSELAEVSS
jgi:tetratricopeptide (TPR) repeat protein